MNWSKESNASPELHPVEECSTDIQSCKSPGWNTKELAKKAWVVIFIFFIPVCPTSHTSNVWHWRQAVQAFIYSDLQQHFPKCLTEIVKQNVHAVRGRKCQYIKINGPNCVLSWEYFWPGDGSDLHLAEQGLILLSCCLRQHKCVASLTSVRREWVWLQGQSGP